MRRDYDEVEIRASGVAHPVVGQGLLEATMHSVDLDQTSWLSDPAPSCRSGKLESRIIVDSTHLGRFMGINDLLVEAPPKETNDATGGTDRIGHLGQQGPGLYRHSGVGRLRREVSVSVDLVVAGPGETRSCSPRPACSPARAPPTRQVPETSSRPRCWPRSAPPCPGQKLPFGVAPTSEGARGSDVIIEGITAGVTITLDEFRQS